MPKATLLNISNCLARGAFVLLLAIHSHLEPVARGASFYSPDPGHVWNRVYEALLVRSNNRVVYDDLLDPPLWYRTKYLLDGESNARAVKTLQEFVEDRAALEKMSPVQRALMQRDLIGVFSWLTERHAKERGGFVPASAAQRALTVVLARAIQHVALSAEAIRSLPDNYAEAVRAQKLPDQFNPASPERPFLPKDLLAWDGPWILLGPDENDSDGVTATVHFKSFKGRSAFEIRMRHPDGRPAGEAYLRSWRRCRNRSFLKSRCWRMLILSGWAGMDPGLTHPHLSFPQTQYGL
jgi:hypothetical protein